MKRFIAMLTAVILTASSLVSAMAFSDVDDSNRYKKAITTLSTLSVIDGYEDGTFKPEGAITRAEFTKLIVYMLGFQNLEYQNYTFGDVESGFWASNFIQAACDYGIVAGFEDGTFRPQDPVTYAQILKMVVCTLGYENFAMDLSIKTTGWADKYIQESVQLGLTQNVDARGYYDPATRGMVAQVLFNALKINMCEYNGYSWISTEKTLLHDYLKVNELKGTLIGVEKNKTEDCTRNLLEDQMDILDSEGKEFLINFSSYTENASDLTKYLGSKLTVYYRQSNVSSDYMLVNIDEDNTKNTIIDLNYDDIAEYSGTSLRYFDKNARSKTARLRSESLTVRYNGKNISEDGIIYLDGKQYTREEILGLWLNPNKEYSIYGTVTLTDNGNDNIYDIIQIYDYEVLVALAAPNTTDYRITDKLVTGNSIILDPESGDYTYTITKAGAQIPVTSIAANDVILCARSLDDEVRTLLVTNETVKGTITSLDSDKSKMTINGKSYNIGERCESYLMEKSNKELKSGATGTFYLDALGTAVYGTLEEAATSPYAYITDAFTNYDEGGKTFITVYAPNVNAGSASSYPLKNNVKINGVATKQEAALNKIQNAASNAGDESAFAQELYHGKLPQNTQYAQPARVTIANGEVTDIVLLTTNEILPQNEDKQSIFKCKELDGYTYSSNSFKIGTQTAFSVNSSTVVIYVPVDRSSRTQYAKKNVSSAFATGDTYYVEAYDLNSSKIAGLLILYEENGTLTKIKKDTDFSVVSKLPEEVYSTAQDSKVLSFDVYAGASNTPRTWQTFDNTEFKDIVVGDVIQFAYDSDNLAQGLVTNISFSDIKEVLDGGKTVDGQLFNWSETQTPSEENNYQQFKFDYIFKKSGTDEDEIFTSSVYPDGVPYSRAAIYNVSQVLTDENKLYVIQSGFQKDGESDTYIYDDDKYDEINITPGTKILRMETEHDKNEITRYASGTTTDLTINDIKDAKNYGINCSKILVCSSKGVAKMILIYNE